jgi:hypothetical protein
VVSFPQVFPAKPCRRLSPLPNVPHVPPISSCLISWPEYLVRRAHLRTPYHASSPLPCYFLPLRPKYLPQHLSSNTLMFLLKYQRPSFTPIENNRQY